MRTVEIPSLILVTNRHSSVHPLSVVAVRAIAGGVDVVQIREPDLNERQLTELSGEIVEAVGDASRVMVNGSATVARALGVGLHLPERAVQPSTEQINGLPLIACSVHSPDAATDRNWANFLIAGHVFPTKSKPGLPPLGPDGLARIVQAATVPVLAIGGVSPERVGSVLATGACGIAVLSAINDARDPEAVARELRISLEESMSETKTTRDTRTNIDVTVNGKPAAIPAGQTVRDYLASRGIHDRMVAVELNGRIIRRAAFESAAISAGDKIEIVHFVGGG